MRDCFLGFWNTTICNIFQRYTSWPLPFLLRRSNPLKHASQKIDILILNLWIGSFVANEDIPFVNNYNKSSPSLFVNFAQCIWQWYCILCQYIRVILIQMFPKIPWFSNLQIGKHFLWIAAFAIICNKHISGNRFSKSAWTAITDIRICRYQNAICVLNQARLVNIYLCI